MKHLQFNRTEFKGKIIGMILGDGCLYNKNDGYNRNSCLQLHHSQKQEEYFNQKVKVLEELTEVKIRKEEGKYPSIFGRTRCHPIYTELWKRFYYNGRKTIDSHLMKLLSPEGLAYWYLDDGKIGEGVIKQSAIICSNSFNETEHNLMAYWLAKKFQLHCGYYKDGNYYHLRIRKKDIDKLIKMISPYTPESMKYKLNFYQVRNNAVKFICKGCGKEFWGEDRVRVFCSKSCHMTYQNNFHLQNGIREIVKI